MEAIAVGVGVPLILAIVGATWKLSGALAANTTKVVALGGSVDRLEGTMEGVLTRLGRLEGRAVWAAATAAQTAEVVRDVVAPQVREVHEAVVDSPYTN